MAGVEPVAGAPVGRSVDESMPTASGSGPEKRFHAVGGRLGIVIGVATIVSARLAVEAFDPVPSDAVTASGIVRPSLVAVVSLVFVVVLAALSMRDRSGVDPAGLVRPGMLAMLVMLARSASHEVAVRAALPELGGDQPIVVVEGILLDDPSPRGSGGSGSLRRSWRLPIRVDSSSHPLLESRRLVVTMSVPDARLVTGTRLTVLGRLAVVPAPMNPGERDRRRGGRDTVPARLVVTSAALVIVKEVGGPKPMQAFRRSWRESAGSVDAALILRGVRSGGLVSAVLAGDRSRLESSIREAAADAGVAPMLAISGWHLGLFAAIVAVLFGRHRPLGRAVALAVIAIFIFAVVPGPSVRRAATMAILSGVLLLAGRRPRSLSVVMIGSGLLAWSDPTIVESIGFVLSVVATIALVAAAGSARCRWFGPPDRIGSRRSSLLRDPLAGMATASLVAWTVSSPIVLASFGRLSWTAVPAMMLVAPAFVVLMTTGMITIVVFMIVGEAPPSLLALTGSTVDALVRLLVALAEVAPITRWTLPPGMETPAIVAAAGLLVSFRHRCVKARWSWRLVAMVVLSLSIATLRTRQIDVRPGFVRVDAIAVGDGTSILVRGSEGSVLVDAGSSSIHAVGRRIVLPALKALGVRSLDAVIVTHANRDHFGEVGSVVRAMPVEKVLVSPVLLDGARRDPDSGIGTWLHDVRSRGVKICEVGRGDRLRFGDLECRVVHPVRDEPCRSANDASIVAAFHLVGDTGARARVLICGDIQDEAMARVMTREPMLGADIMELPHHGSWRPMAATLLDRVDPRAIVQSTGPDRWWLDRWRDACGHRRRGITARDGLVSFEVDSTGRVRSRDLGGSEEPEAGFVTSVGRTSVGSGPDDHDGPIDPRSFGKRGVEHARHAFEQGRAR